MKDAFRIVLPCAVSAFSLLLWGGTGLEAQDHPADGNVAKQEPSGPLWDALGRVPVREGAEVLVFDYPEVRAHRERFLGSGADSRAHWVWTQAVRIFELPEKTLGRVISVEEPTHNDDCLWLSTSADPKEIRAALAKKGRVPEERGSATVFTSSVYPGDPGMILDAFFDGMVLHANRDPEVMERALAVREGKHPSLRTHPGVSEVVQEVPPTMPCWLVYGKLLEEPGISVRPQLVAGSLRREGAERIDVYFYGDEERARAGAEDIKKSIKEHGGNAEVGRSGRAVRIIAKVAASFQVTAEVDLQNLQQSLALFKVDNVYYPSTEQGLEHLLEGGKGGMGPYSYSEGFCGEVPKDPWGRAYIYRYPYPEGSAGYDLRSAGPDGSPDTADDVLP